MTILYSQNFDSLTVGSAVTGFVNIGAANFVVGVSGNVSSPNSFGEASPTDGDKTVFTGFSATADMSCQFSFLGPSNTANFAFPGIELRSDSGGTQGYIFNLGLATGGFAVYAQTGTTGFAVVTNATGTGAGGVTTAGTVYKIKAEVQGTAIRARFWPAASAEPTSWNFAGTDGSITTAGYPAIRYFGPTTPSGASIVTADDLFFGTPGTTFGGGGGTALSVTAPTITGATATTTTVGVSVAGGTAPYTVTFYRSTISGTRGTSIQSGTSQTLADTGLTPGTVYYYTVVVTDSASGTLTSSQLGTATYLNSGIYPSPTNLPARASILPTLTFGTGTYSNDIGNPLILFDPVNNRWANLYNQYSTSTSLWSTKLAYAAYNTADPYFGVLGPYTYEPTNPVDLPQSSGINGNEGSIAGNGGVAYIGGQWIMVAQTGPSLNAYLMTSPDLKTWTRAGEIFGLGGSGALDAGGCDDFCLLPNPSGTGLLCVYIGISSVASGGNTGPTTLRTFMTATSNSAGTVWTKVGPLYTVPSSFAPFNTGEPYLIIDANGGYHLVFDYAAVTDGDRSIGAVYSPDGTNWTPPYTLLSGSGGSSASNYDSQQVFDACPRVVNGNYVLCHAGGTANGGTTGMISQAGFAVIRSGLTSATGYTVTGIPSTPVAGETYTIAVILNNPASASGVVTFGAQSGVTWGGPVSLASGAISGTTAVTFTNTGSVTPTCTHTGLGFSGDPNLASITVQAAGLTLSQLNTALASGITTLAPTGLNSIAGVNGWSFPQMLRALTAFVIGKRSGVPASGSAGTVTFTNATTGDGGTVTVDASGNITANSMTPTA